MKKIYFTCLLAGGLTVHQSAQAQCDIEVFSYGWPTTMPYACVGDTVEFVYYIMNYGAFNSVTLHWGDGTQEALNPPFIQGYISHVYTQPGTYFPYFETQGTVCGDTIIPFEIIAYPYPGDSLSPMIPVNYLVISQNCIPQSGVVYIDLDGDCQYSQFQDIPLANKMIEVTNLGPGITGTVVFSNGQGQFAFSGPSGITFKLPQSQVSAAYSPACGTTQSGNHYLPNGSNDFVFNCTGGQDLSISSYFSILAQTVFSPIGFIVYNQGCDTIDNAVITITLNNQVIPNTGSPATIYHNQMYISVTPTFSGNTVTLQGLPSLPPQSWLSGHIWAQANPQNTALGDEVCVTLSVSPVAGDVNPANNTDTFCGLVVTSYDPNDKLGSCQNKSAHGEVEANNDMIYTIRFQNTGNFPARDIRITDTLSLNLNLNTLQILASSHPMTTWLNGRVITFYFDEIWLQDAASNEPASHGHVTFKIAQNPNLAPGTQILNNADIYFDYNPAIRTNTVVSVIKSVGMTSEAHPSVRLTPNPTTGQLWIQGVEKWPVTVRIGDLSGKMWMQKTLTHAQAGVELDGVPAGIYTVEVEGVEGLQGRFKIVISER
jgi:uncharacterized repeat protein (TIGR01451 family)